MISPELCVALFANSSIQICVSPYFHFPILWKHRKLKISTLDRRNQPERSRALRNAVALQTPAERKKAKYSLST